ncbi:hypothetical protein [Labrys miyagiensis]|nr:hypothetical protein [Labrys miyagiensis]
MQRFSEPKSYSAGRLLTTIGLFLDGAIAGLLRFARHDGSPIPLQS